VTGNVDYIDYMVRESYDLGTERESKIFRGR